MGIAIFLSSTLFFSFSALSLLCNFQAGRSCDGNAVILIIYVWGKTSELLCELFYLLNRSSMPNTNGHHVHYRLIRM